MSATLAPEATVSSPTSPAAPGAQPDTIIDSTAEVGDKKLTELVDAWISAMNRIPKFLQLTQPAPPPPMGGEDATPTIVAGGLLGWLTRDVRPLHLPDPFVAFNRRVLHPFFIRRRMMQEARALGLEPRFARVLAERFEAIWRAGQTHELGRDEQTRRIVELLQRPGG